MTTGHEPDRIDAPVLHKLGVIFVLALVLILSLMYWLWMHVQAPTLSATPQRIPPPPQLQVIAPPDRIRQYRLQTQRLESYGWVDAGHRVAHIPIERAMALLVSKGGAGPSDHRERSGSP